MTGQVTSPTSPPRPTTPNGQGGPNTPRAAAQLAPGIFWVEQEISEGKNGVVIGRRAALAVDSGNSHADGQAMVDLIRAQGGEPTLLAVTHGHGDHVIGSSAFAGAEVFSHAQTPAVIRRHLPNMIQNRQRPNLETELTWPTVTFGGELKIDLGGKTVRLLPTPGHSEDGICAFVEEDRILFSGDTAGTINPPVLNDGDSRQLEDSLRRLADLGAETLVPGHGAILHGRPRVRAHLLWAAGYLAAVRTHVQTLLAHGLSQDAIVNATPYDQFVGDHLPRHARRSDKPHQFAVTKILSEVM